MTYEKIRPALAVIKDGLALHGIDPECVPQKFYDWAFAHQPEGPSLDFEEEMVRMITKKIFQTYKGHMGGRQ